jgi:hypothetical protein
VEIFIDNNKITDYSFTQSGMNILGYDTINETFFDVFLIKNKDIELLKEKKGDFNGLPIIELDLCINDKLYKNVRFLVKENKGININPNLLDHLNSIEFEKINKKPEQKPIKYSVVEEKAEPKKITKPKKISEKTQIIKEEKLIDKVKNNFLESIKKELIESLKNEINTGNISDILKDNIHNNFSTILENDGFQYRIQKLFQNSQNVFRKDLIEIAEKIARREVMRFSESGGGTNASNNSNYYKKLIFIIGDGSNTEYTLNHGLNNTELFITIYDNNTNEVIYADIININENTTLIRFDSPPANQSCKIVILG